MLPSLPCASGQTLILFSANASPTFDFYRQPPCRTICFPKIPCWFLIQNPSEVSFFKSYSCSHLSSVITWVVAFPGDLLQPFMPSPRDSLPKFSYVFHWYLFHPSWLLKVTSVFLPLLQQTSVLFSPNPRIWLESTRYSNLAGKKTGDQVNVWMGNWKPCTLWWKRGKI